MKEKQVCDRQIFLKIVSTLKKKQKQKNNKITKENFKTCSVKKKKKKKKKKKILIKHKTMLYFKNCSVRKHINLT